jgi:flagellar biosynthesis/type III secretory pathway chaperone
MPTNLTPEQLIAEARELFAIMDDESSRCSRREVKEAAWELSKLTRPLADALTAALKERDEERIAHNHFTVVMEQRALSAESKLTAALERIKALEAELEVVHHDYIERLNAD